MSSKVLLLQDGTVLVHDEHDHVQVTKVDVLIEGDKISLIQKNIDPGADAEIIDCKDKLISPGFIDTHHHVWQSLLKGRHANQLLLEYLYTGNILSSLHPPEEIFWGELGGVLECLDVGTTTVVDHAHMNYSADHSKAAIAATVSSGIRSIFGYCPTNRVESWSPFTVSQNLFPDWVLGTLTELASKAPFGNGRVQLGFAFDGYFLPKEMVIGIFEQVKALGIKLVTSHYIRQPTWGIVSLPEMLKSYGLLDSSILFSHATNSTPEDGKLLLESNSHVSCTPSTELQMALGIPVAFQDNLGIQSQCSVGIDCHSNGSASIVSELRLLLQSARGMNNHRFLKAGVEPKAINKTVEEAFNLGTIGGARAVNMQDQIGSIKVGKKADLVIWDMLSPSMVCAAEHDPVAAIVLHSSTHDVQTVIVDGVVRKRDGKLVDIDVGAGKEVWSGVAKESLTWSEVARELIDRRKVMQEKIDKLDMAEARKGLIQAMYMDESKIVEKV